MSRRIRVLHVDDDPDLAGLVATFLEREDERFAVETATSASDGLDALDDAVDCVVSDYDMSGSDGVEFLQAVREEYPDLPFLLFTGKGSEEVASEAISAGVTDYLQKETGTSQYAVLANRIANAVEQYRSKRELEDSRRRLSLFFEQSPLGVIEWNEEFEFDRLNAAAEGILGYEEAELLGESWTAVVQETDREEVGAVTDAILGDVGGYHNVNENVRKDGEVIVCEWHNRVITDDDGAVLSVFSLFQDVTDRKEREWELERHRENLQELHEAANRLYAAESVEECYDVMIEAAVEILGFDWCTLAAPADDDGDVFEIRAISEETPLEVGDRPFAIDEGVAGHVYQVSEASIVDDVQEAEEGEPTNEEIRAALTVPVADWGIFQAVATTAGAFDEQDCKHAELLVSSMLATIERLEQQAELRERQRALERQNDRLDEFASVVSHDLRNPLTVANGRLELAREALDAAPPAAGENGDLGDRPASDERAVVAEHFDAVEGAHDRMQTLIDDLLALARHGETPTEIAVVDLETIATDSWRAVETDGATLDVDADVRVRADENRLRQLFENCFRNAVEHGSTSPRSQAPEDAVEHGSTSPRSTSSHEDAVEPGGPAVTVGPLSDGGFFVEDDGPGTPSDEGDRLFDFGYSTSEEGTGLGLSIVAEIVEAHGWEIRATNGTAGGARFEITGVETIDRDAET